MCLILLAVDSHPEFPLVVAANRDEYYARPTRTLQPWPEAPQLLAGKDLNAGGTWLGLTRSGRFAAVTNARDSEVPAQPRSRGALTLDFLLSNIAPEKYAQQIWREGQHYAGFNLLIGDRNGLYYCSNGDASPRRLGAGFYGIANASLDTPWPKVENGKTDLRAALQHSPNPTTLLKILDDDQSTATELTAKLTTKLKNADTATVLEQIYTNRFIRSPTYGTRASTALLLNRAGIATVWEQNFGSGGAPEQLSQYRWALDPLST